LELNSFNAEREGKDKLVKNVLIVGFERQTIVHVWQVESSQHILVILVEAPQLKGEYQKASHRHKAENASPNWRRRFLF
jgi:hypothetical protein